MVACCTGVGATLWVGFSLNWTRVIATSGTYVAPKTLVGESLIFSRVLVFLAMIFINSLSLSSIPIGLPRLLANGLPKGIFSIPMDSSDAEDTDIEPPSDSRFGCSITQSFTGCDSAPHLAGEAAEGEGAPAVFLNN